MDENIVEDDDQSSVGSSSDSSTLNGPSCSSQFSTDDLLSVVDGLVNLLANDQILKPLYRAAVSDQTIGGDVFEANFRRLLESCSEELKMEAHRPLHEYASKKLRSRAAYLSHRLRALHDPGYDDKEKEMRKVHTQRNERLGPGIVEQVNSWSQALISPDFSNATASGVSCPICFKEFKGNLEDAKSKLRRHLRSSPRHTRMYGLKCPMPECEKKNPMRSDNLEPHLQNFHKISSKSNRQSIIEHCRQSLPDREMFAPEYLMQVAGEAEEEFRASQFIEQEPEPDGDRLDPQNLIMLKEFLLSSDAFRNLRTKFEQYMLPAETTVLFPDIPQQVNSAKNEGPPGVCAETDHSASPQFSKALSLQVTKMQTLHTSIRNRLAGLSSLFWGQGSRMPESYMRRWEPLIDRDKVRIRWECRCGRKLWDDFRELRPSAAEDLRRSLQFNESTASAQETNDAQQPPSSYSLGGNGTVSVARMPVSSHAGALGHSSAAAAAEDGVVATEPPSSTSPGPEPKFLLLCFRKPGDTLRLYHLSVEDVTTDFQLFHLLQQTYRAYQGLLGRCFSPRKIKSVVFRKLERHPHERVVIRSCSDIVPCRINPGVCHKDHDPKCDTEYDIYPEPPDLDPYVGPNGLEHLLSHPHEAEEQGNNLPIQDVWLKRFPKKKKSKLTACPPYQYGLGWGIEFDETWNFSLVLKGILFGCVLAATVFLICWWSVRGDVQGATGMAALLVSYCVLLISLFSACALA